MLPSSFRYHRVGCALAVHCVYTHKFGLSIRVLRSSTSFTSCSMFQYQLQFLFQVLLLALVLVLGQLLFLFQVLVLALVLVLLYVNSLISYPRFQHCSRSFFRFQYQLQFLLQVLVLQQFQFMLQVLVLALVPVLGSSSGSSSCSRRQYWCQFLFQVLVLALVLVLGSSTSSSSCSRFQQQRILVLGFITSSISCSDQLEEVCTGRQLSLHTLGLIFRRLLLLLLLNLSSEEYRASNWLSCDVNTTCTFVHGQRTTSYMFFYVDFFDKPQLFGGTSLSL